MAKRAQLGTHRPAALPPGAHHLFVAPFPSPPVNAAACRARRRASAVADGRASPSLGTTLTAGGAHSGGTPGPHPRAATSAARAASDGWINSQPQGWG